MSVEGCGNREVPHDFKKKGVRRGGNMVSVTSPLAIVG